MKSTILLLTFLLFGEIYLQAQKLYMPRNITEVYKNGTRSMDGDAVSVLVDAKNNRRASVQAA